MSNAHVLEFIFHEAIAIVRIQIDVDGICGRNTVCTRSGSQEAREGHAGVKDDEGASKVTTVAWRAVVGSPMR